MPGRPPKGEIAGVVGASRGKPRRHARLDALLAQALSYVPVNKAAALVAEATGSGRAAWWGCERFALKKKPEMGDAW